MKKLGSSDQFKPNKNKVDQILKNFDLELLNYSELVLGIENTSLKVYTKQGVFVLRILRKDKKTDSKLKLELEFMDYLKKHGLPIPTIQQTSGGKNFVKYKDGIEGFFSCVLMDFMPGDHIEKYSRPQLKNLAKIMSKLQNLGERFARLKKFKRKSNYFYSIKKKDITVQSPKLKKFFEKSFLYKARLQNTKHIGFYHLDLDCRNILFSGDKISAILDFDDCAFASTVHDLAALAEDIFSSNRNASDVDYFLKEYKKLKNLGSDMGVVKRLVHIFNFYYMKIHIDLYGEKNKRVSELVELEKMISEWDELR